MSATPLTGLEEKFDAAATLPDDDASDSGKTAKKKSSSHIFHTPMFFKKRSKDKMRKDGDGYHSDADHTPPPATAVMADGLAALEQVGSPDRPAAAPATAAAAAQRTPSKSPFYASVAGAPGKIGAGVLAAGGDITAAGAGFVAAGAGVAATVAGAASDATDAVSAVASTAADGAKAVAGTTGDAIATAASAAASEATSVATAVPVPSVEPLKAPTPLRVTPPPPVVTLLPPPSMPQLEEDAEILAAAAPSKALLNGPVARAVRWSVAHLKPVFSDAGSGELGRGLARSPLDAVRGLRTADAVGARDLTNRADVAVVGLKGVCNATLQSLRQRGFIIRHAVADEPEIDPAVAAAAAEAAKAATAAANAAATPATPAAKPGTPAAAKPDAAVAAAAAMPPAPAVPVMPALPDPAEQTMTVALALGPKLLAKLALEEDIPRRAPDEYTIPERAQMAKAAIRILQRSGLVFSEALLLHDPYALKAVGASMHPDAIACYFGSGIGLYFAWLRHYTNALAFPAAAGVVLYVSQLMSGVDTVFVPAFCIFVSLWCTVYLTSWHRREAATAFGWQVLDVEDEEEREMLAEQVDKPQVPASGRYLVTVPINAVVLFAVIRVMLYCQYITDHTTELYGTNSWWKYWPTLMYSVVPPVCSVLYGKLSVALNKFEHHASKRKAINSLILKRFAFECVNSYCSLFFIAFFLRDMDRLRTMLFSLMTVKQVIGNIVEIGMPYVTIKVKEFLAKRRAKKAEAAARKLEEDAKKAVAAAAVAAAGGVGPAALPTAAAAARANKEPTVYSAGATAEAVAEEEQPLLSAQQSLEQTADAAAAVETAAAAQSAAAAPEPTPPRKGSMGSSLVSMATGRTPLKSASPAKPSSGPGSGSAALAREVSPARAAPAGSDAAPGYAATPPRKGSSSGGLLKSLTPGKMGTPRLGRSPSKGAVVPLAAVAAAPAGAGGMVALAASETAAAGGAARRGSLTMSGAAGLAVKGKRLAGAARVRSQLSKVTEEAFEAELQQPDVDIGDEYMEMIIQFGYCTMFAVVFPLAPLMALLNNVAEYHIDLSKLLGGRRPPAFVAGNIGAWGTCLSILGHLATVTNCVIMAMMSDNMGRYIPTAWNGLLASTEGKVLLAIIFEHLLLALKAVVQGVVDPVPLWVRQRQAKIAAERHEQHKKYRLLAHNVQVARKTVDKEEVRRAKLIERLQGVHKTIQPWSFGPWLFGPLVAMPYFVGWTGLSGWVVLPVAVAIVGYMQHQKAKADVGLALGIVSDPQVLRLIGQELPSWFTDGEFERVEFINKLLAKMWRPTSLAVKQMVTDVVQPILNQYRPAGITALGFKRVSLGTLPPKVVAVRVLDVSSSRATIDVELKWASDAVFVLEAGVKPLPLVLELNKIRFSGKMRVELDPLVPVIPMFGALSITFMERPLIDFSFKVAKLDIMSIGPGDMSIGKAVTSTIKKIINDILVFPKKLVIPIMEGVDLNAVSNPQPAGILQVHITSAEALRVADSNGFSDPYVIVAVGEEVLKTMVIQKDLNPVWDADLDFMVHDPGQAIVFKVMDSDKGVTNTFSSDDALGEAEVRIQSLHPGVDTPLRLVLQDTTTGALNVVLTYTPLTQPTATDDDADDATQDVLFTLDGDALTDEVVSNDAFLSAAAGPDGGAPSGPITLGAGTVTSARPQDANSDSQGGGGGPVSVGVLTVSEMTVSDVKPGGGIYLVLTQGSRSRTTIVEKQTTSPFPETFHFLVRGYEGASLRVSLMAKSSGLNPVKMVSKDKCVGTVKIPVADVVGSGGSGELEDTWTLEGSEVSAGTLAMKLVYTSAADAR